MGPGVDGRMSVTICRGVDFRNSVLLIAAGGLAVMGTLGANADHAILGWQFAGQVLAVEAAVSFLLALMALGGRWPAAWRRMSLLFAVAALVVGVPVALFTFARTCSLCQDVTFVFPRILGISEQWWVVIALVGVPAMLLLAGLLSTKSRRAMPSEAGSVD
jgi:hypothetical protein